MIEETILLKSLKKDFLIFFHNEFNNDHGSFCPKFFRTFLIKGEAMNKIVAFIIVVFCGCSNQQPQNLQTSTISAKEAVLVGYITPTLKNENDVLRKIETLSEEGNIQNVEIIESRPKLIIAYAAKKILSDLQVTALRDINEGDVVTNRLLVAGPFYYEMDVFHRVSKLAHDDKLVIVGDKYNSVFPVLTGSKKLIDSLIIETSVDLGARCEID